MNIGVSEMVVKCIIRGDKLGNRDPKMNIYLFH